MFILQEDNMNIRRSNLPAKASTRSIISAIVMLIGILILAWGYYGGTNMLIGLGLMVILSGLVPQVVFGLLGQSLESNVTRRHI
jgi:dipeptide/tripeptide permease